MAFRVAPPYSSQLRARVRWRRVLRRAAAREGGGWPADFDPAHDLTAARVTQLAALIDEELLEGRLQALAGRPGAPLTYGVQAAHSDSEAVSAGYSPAENRVIVYRAPWAREVSAACPVQVDGVYTLSRLEWLAHTLGHEMVHAIVETSCPAAAAEPSMRAAQGHGPLFQRLNRHLLGHTAAAKYVAGWRRDGRRYVRGGGAGGGTAAAAAGGW
ncbi:MAG: hypothetical protein J3K34DRAFT_467018 [Monoraphidium minutum]|nr:MAG: hypothetical protein J3K34DRAFT_467018 [Monoraphidium minutum]